MVSALPQKRERSSKRTDSPRPPLKWAGGKRWLVPSLEKLWNPFATRRYIEPFCGGLAAALGLSPTKAILNDINPHLINFYRQLKRGLDVHIPMRNEKTLYYQHRERFNQLIRDQNAETSLGAQLFYYLNRTCFNGLCRFNQSGEFNVPFGTYLIINYEKSFNDYVDAFKDWDFTNRDIADLKFEQGDFVYADPPYDVEFTSYSAGGFSWNDQIRTAELLAAHDGPVVISNQATPRIVELYKTHRFDLTYQDAPRRISCTGDRSTAKEILATRNI